jgi:hypothetical protein
MNRFLPLAPLLLAALSALTAAEAGDRLWIGPMPFIEARTLRDDYYATVTDAGKWPTVLARADVFKSYIMVLPSDPVPGKPGPELSDKRMQRMARFMREHNLKVAFEVGGIRMGPDTPNDQAGEVTAEGELRHLKRWLANGGTIDYLTTDHGVMSTIGSPYIVPAQYKQRGMSLQQAIDELVDYFAIMHREIPTAKFGVIESLGFFTVQGLDGKEYPRTVPALPVWKFADYFDMLLGAMKRRGLALDHFHIDFGFEGVRHDGGGKDHLDFGRIRGVESYVQSKGVNAGLIVNAFHDTTNKSPQRDAANREAYERTLRFYNEYKAAGGQAKQILLQTWMPYPDRTGPEDAPHTVLNMDRDIIRGGIPPT